jgi:hypothetical protein
MRLSLGRTFPLLITRWQSPDQRLHALCKSMRETGAVVLHGGNYDAWDLEVRGSPFGSARMLMAVEDTGSGTQLVRVRSWPYCRRTAWTLMMVLVLLLAAALVSGSIPAASVLVLFSVLGLGEIVRGCGVATGAIEQGLIRCGLVEDQNSMTVREAHQEPTRSPERRRLQRLAAIRPNGAFLAVRETEKRDRPERDRRA